MARLVRLSIVVTLLMAVGLSAFAAGRFTDDDGSVHEGNIEAIAAEGITRGCNPPVNDLYCPSDPVTRGQMAAFLRRAFSLPAANQDYFIDDSSNLFEGDINALAEAGITRGCNPPRNNQYCPDGFVTRGQMAAFLRRAFSYPPTGNDFFIDDEGSVFEADINAIAAERVTLGCNPPLNNRYCPDDLVRRDQMASFLARALGLKPIPPPDPCKDFAATDIFVSLSGNDSNDGTCDHPVRTIQRGIDIAPVGGRVLVDSGTYREQVEIPKRITLEALSGSSPEIDGLGGDVNHSVVEIRLGVQATIDGFAISNSPRFGIHNKGTLTLRDATIRANDNSGVFNEEGATLTVTDTTISDHVGDSSLWGWGLQNEGTATLTDVVIRDNDGSGLGNTGDLTGTRLRIASNRTGIINQLGPLILTHSVIEDNHSDNLGGGLYNSNGGTTTLIETSVVNNTAAVGAGIYNAPADIPSTTFQEAGTLILDRMLVANNTASSLGGGIYNGGTATLENTTLSSNEAGANGGGIYGAGGFGYSTRGIVDLTNVTIALNTAPSGGGIYVEPGGVLTPSGTVDLKNTIVADSLSGLDCVAETGDYEDGNLTSLGHNLDSDNSCHLTASTDLPAATPQLGSLADNGGSTATHALAASSLAVDAADDSAAPATDQRGISRPQGPQSDIGAYELVK